MHTPHKTDLLFFIGCAAVGILLAVAFAVALPDRRQAASDDVWAGLNARAERELLRIENMRHATSNTPSTRMY